MWVCVYIITKCILRWLHFQNVNFSHNQPCLPLNSEISNFKSPSILSSIKMSTRVAPNIVRIAPPLLLIQQTQFSLLFPRTILQKNQKVDNWCFAPPIRFSFINFANRNAFPALLIWFSAVLLTLQTCASQEKSCTSNSVLKLQLQLIQCQLI